MKHLGDISKVNGASIAPVDIITFGSPCQDLSIAGKQAGLDGNRSGLFREAVRIIKEMRDATNGKQPRFAVWENVPGAYSSNKGADFQTVLQELCKITEPKAPAISIPKAGWPPAGQLTDVGGGSLAWRTIDAQFHGVPQRRRRIILVCDFAGQRAGDLLFKPRGLPGYPAEGVCEGQASPGAATIGADRAVVGFAYRASPSSGSVAEASDIAPTLLAARNDAAVCLNDQGGRRMDITEGITSTLRTEMHGNAPIVFRKGTRPHNAQEGQTYEPAEIANTLNTFDTGEARANELVVSGYGETGRGYWQPGIQTLRAAAAHKPSNCVVLQGSMIGRSDENGPNGAGLAEDVSFTLTAVDRHAIAYDCRNHTPNGEVNPTLQAKSNGGHSLNYINPICVAHGQANAEICEDLAPTLNCNHEQPYIAGGYTIRRLTPTECARLQGFPDWWASLPTITDMSDETFDFWQEVRSTHAAINGKKYKPVKKPQMIRWYNRLHTDSAEYKMWGNGVALPVVRIPLHGMAQLGATTLGSLFDGSGGFPLAGLLDGITTLWASEVEPYPIAVTEWNFSGRAQLLLGGAIK
ncbi:DNA cytosine methyltransferase [Eubacteriales bacterium OttesenSCG-928-A19]|nr:DNA cytosine methyltransferase [Eubacteriales bacterium OttesenSCG-928-A19]